MRANVSFQLVVALVAAATPCARAGDLHVPAGYATIQAAIDAAVGGDVVLVDPGTYHENIDFKGKAITVKSTGGAKSTTIDGGMAGSCVNFASGEQTDSVLGGFTLTNGGWNVSGHSGGGVHVESSSPTIEDNVITWSQAQNGGGISTWYSAPVIRRNVVMFNVANGDGGGISIDIGSSPLLIDNIVCKNTSTGAGGGIQCYSSTPLIVNCTIANNSAGTNGGGVLCWVATATLVNCIAWGNTSNQLGLDPFGTINATYSCVQGGWTGTGNISADPLFVDSTNGDFHLTAGSPCIDAGDDGAPNLPATDLDGDARIVGAHVDIGADEVTFAPVVLGVSPSRTRYDVPASVTITGAAFSFGTGMGVTIAGNAASNVVVVDDGTITCDALGGLPGPVDVVVSNSLGVGTLSGGFVYTPAITIEGDPVLGASITIHNLCDPGNGIFAVLGLPPQVSIPTPPFDGDLAIVPFHYFFYVTAWPFDSFDVPATIPNDPALAGVDVLLQSLIGPQLTKPPKDGSWTNCAVLSIH